MKRFFLPVVSFSLILVASLGQAETAKIANLRFSDNPITLGEWFTISFDYEGTVEKYFIENTYETQEGVVKREVKDFAAKPEVRDNSRGAIQFKWKSENGTAKPYRILKVWVKDGNGRESNALSGEVKVQKDMLTEEVKILMQLKSVFGTKTLHLSGTVYRPASGERFPLVVINHGTPREAEERKKVLQFREQSRAFVKRGFAVVVPMRRGYGTSEGEYAEASGKCDSADYDRVAREVIKDIQATVEFMRKQPYVDTNRKVLVAGVSVGGFSSLAYASAYPEDVAAVINFAGGKGSVEPYKVCSEESLVYTVGNFGKTIRVPTIWIYTEKDDFFPPKLSKKMFESYRRKGGEGRFLLLSSEHGHSFFARGTKEWEPIIDEFLEGAHLLSQKTATLRP